MNMICPTDPSHAEFITTAHEIHDWVVAADGSFIEDLGCIETAHWPNSDNVWTCRECDAEAVRGERPEHDA